jgi:hypothetical protein
METIWLHIQISRKDFRGFERLGSHMLDLISKALVARSKATESLEDLDEALA